MRKTVVGVMGPGEGATATDLERARALGRLIAGAGWVLLTGGRRSGVMDAASEGAHEAGGLVLGILPDADDRAISQHVDIAIMTGVGSARNNINVLTSDAVVACGMGAGTASEVALALKAGKTVLLLSDDPVAHQFFQNLDAKRIKIVTSPDDAFAQIKQLLGAKEAVTG